MPRLCHAERSRRVAKATLLRSRSIPTASQHSRAKLQNAASQMKTALLLAILALISAAAAQEITVAAAADLQFAMQDIAAQFEKQTGKQVKLIYGSSGNFFQQIQNGAPFDMFFSANLDYPKKLDAAGLVEKETFYRYAKGKIVIGISNDSKLKISAGLKVFLDPA